MENSLKHDLSTAGIVLLVLLLAQSLLRMPFLLIQRGLFFLNGYGLSSFWAQLGEAVWYLGAMLLTIFFAIWVWQDGRPGADAGLRSFLFPLGAPMRQYLYPALGVGLGGAMVGNLIASLVTVLLALGGVYTFDGAPSFTGGPGTILLTYLSVAVLPAVLEELLFRGALLQPLRKYGDKTAIVFSALLFALCHSSLPQAVNAFFMGLLLGLFAVRTGSLVTSMLLHFLYNSAACAVSLAAAYLPLPAASLLSWLVIFFLLAWGIYSLRTLRRRFGPVFWTPEGALYPMGGGEAAAAALRSVPFVLAVILCVAVVLRGLQFYG